MNWVAILKTVVELLPSIAGLVRNVLAGNNPVDTKATAADHVATLTRAVQGLNGPGSMRMLPPDVGSSVRDSLTAAAHAHMSLLRTLVDHQDTIRGAIENIPRLEAETAPAPTEPQPAPVPREDLPHPDQVLMLKGSIDAALAYLKGLEEKKA